MSKDLIIYGAGGLGKDVAWQLAEKNRETNEYDILGFVDDAPGMAGRTVNGLRVLGGMDWIGNRAEAALKESPAQAPGTQKSGLNVMIAIADPRIRKQKYEALGAMAGISFPVFTARGVMCSEYAQIGRGCILLSACIVSPDAVLGDFVVAHYGCTIGHDSSIGAFSIIYPAVNISGNVHIGRLCEIGTGTQVIQGHNIDENTVIGAGAVVTRNIPANCTAVGIPARPVRGHA